ncbi:hypothetical protein [Geodermatophilus sp. CPCC 205761]|uniref:hypothetical protein n=1 Tax=Geodermatophilus sp. CPCC 205761 TaxID=2936597 RepID=UPI003EEC635D
MPSSGAFGAISTGNLMADCERWCRDNLPPRVPVPGLGASLRVVPVRAPVAAPAPSRRGAFRPGPSWPGVPVALTGS